MNIKLDAGDVQVVALETEECDCGEEITHAVKADLRNNGVTIEVFRGCKRCAVSQAKRLKESLPKERP